MRLSPDAFDAFENWHNDNVERINAGGNGSGFYAKMPAHVARLALVLHCLKHAQPGNCKVSEQTMCDAIELGEFYAHHMRLVRAELGQLVPPREARLTGRVLRHLRSEAHAGIEWNGRSELMNTLRIDAARLDETVSHLIEQGKIEDRTRSTSTKPATEYRLITETGRS